MPFTKYVLTCRLLCSHSIFPSIPLRDAYCTLQLCLSLFPSVRIRMPLFHSDFLRRWIEHPNSHNSNNNNHNFSFIIPLQSCRKISRYKFVSTESLLVTTTTTTTTTTAAVAAEAPAEVIAAAIRATVTTVCHSSEGKDEREFSLHGFIDATRQQ